MIIKRFMEYHVHFMDKDFGVSFEVYPVVDWTDGKTKGTAYIDLEREPEIREVFEPGKCLMKMQGTHVWRGCWEGRLYFTDSEYWCEDLTELATLFKDHIEPFCEKYIVSKEPNAKLWQ